MNYICENCEHYGDEFTWHDYHPCKLDGSFKNYWETCRNFRPRGGIE